jgi:hypothetical protein
MMIVKKRARDFCRAENRSCSHPGGEQKAAARTAHMIAGEVAAKEPGAADSVLPNHANLVRFTSNNRRGRQRLGPERREDRQLASRACDGDVEAAMAAFVVGRGYLGDAASLVRTDGHREDDDVPFVALHILDVLDQDGSFVWFGRNGPRVTGRCGGPGRARSRSGTAGRR